MLLIRSLLVIECPDKMSTKLFEENVSISRNFIIHGSVDVFCILNVIKEYIFKIVISKTKV